MTKKDLTDLFHDSLQKNLPSVKFSKQNVVVMIDTFFTVLSDAISDGNTIELRGFGTFKTKIRKEKEIKKPTTNDKILLKETAIPIFKPGKYLKKITEEKFYKKN